MDIKWIAPNQFIDMKEIKHKFLHFFLFTLILVIPDTIFDRYLPRLVKLT